eukprot:NODE_10679_length_1336_cov_1.468156.p6 GENE.NODE_10679_length_1336_cov_1.468156~~NODE_10679_length_1336_cov_1.468156.p6  ORF type:complete len:70 (+),score=11.34 NODE_10679_length_1336_cov_1.468156:79-288(+)
MQTLVIQQSIATAGKVAEAAADATAVPYSHQPVSMSVYQRALWLPWRRWLPLQDQSAPARQQHWPLRLL